MSKIKDLPLSERPRERLQSQGVDALSNAELIAILLNTGVQGKSTLHVAQEMIGHFGGVEGLFEASIEELMQIRGVGRAKATLLKAAFGLAMKNRMVDFTKVCLDDPEKIFHLLKDRLGREKQEVLIVVLKDVRGRLILQEEVARGTLSKVLVHPREVFYPAVRHKAKSIVLAHNHPSGDPTPSKDDIVLTRKLIEASKVMGIRIDDHIIFGGDAFESLFQMNYSVNKSF